jgi:RNA polymerase sigma factor (sigma-70 family)
MAYLRARPELLERFRRGERDALAEVYTAYLPRVHALLQRGFTLRRTGLRVPGLTTRDDLADAIQDVFLRAFAHEARARYDGLRDYGPYLAVIARNAVVTRHRRQGSRFVVVDPKVLSEDDLTEAAPSEADEAESWLDPRAVEAARRYVVGLDESAHALHTALYVNALSQREAARELGLSRSKVRRLEDKLLRGLTVSLVEAGLFQEDSRQRDPALTGTGAGSAFPRTGSRS